METNPQEQMAKAKASINRLQLLLNELDPDQPGYRKQSAMLKSVMRVAMKKHDEAKSALNKVGK